MFVSSSWLSSTALDVSDALVMTSLFYTSIVVVMKQNERAITECLPDQVDQRGVEPSNFLAADG
jgi:hypothetical protein